MGELKQLGRYEIVRVLGSGAMGVVYEGHDSKLHRQVAIKTIIKSALVDEAQVADYSARFMREAQAVAQLNHPNIVTVYDFGEEGEIAYFVMEFIQGHELKQYLDSGVQFSLSKSIGLIIELLDALDYAHSRGIVHRDIKPANIMIDPSGRLKLTDFGVVKVLDSQEGTQAGTMVGTPGYMSPEQILGTGVSPRSDIFAAGVVLYQLLTWKKPFTGEGVFTIQQKIINENPAPPSTLDANLPPFLDQVVNKALAKKPEQRYTHASEFADDLKRFLAMDATQQTIAAAEKTIVTSGGVQQPVEKTSVTATGKSDADESDLEKILEEREKLDSAINEKFTKVITVVFTDIKGSTALNEAEGDLFSRLLIKHETDIIKPAVLDNKGTFVKSIGDGTLSHFENALDALRAAVRIQKGMDELNMSKKFKAPVLMRIGMHTGRCVVEANDIFGDVVNTASRFESSADPGGILMSEDTYNALSDKSEIYCRFVKQVTLKGKKEPFNAYKVFWNPQEIELDKQGKEALPRQELNVPIRSSGMKMVWGAVALLVIVMLLTLGSKFFGSAQQTESKRSISHSVDSDGAPDTQHSPP
ncbi:MAG: protein kinase [Sideroxyarcus sp.]|nr:protein kinase [Sideroxyarcus sp.]